MDQRKARLILPNRLKRFMHFGLAFLAVVMLLSHLSVAMAVGRARSHWRSEQFGLGSNRAMQIDKDVRPLEIGKPIQRELAGGQSHTYHLTLTAGQYLHVVVDQRGIDVVVALFSPDGNKLAEVDSPNGTQGPEPLHWIVDISGTYKLEVRSLEKDAPTGRYEVKIEEIRIPTEQDRSRIAAERDYAEGELLRARGTAESLRKAVTKYEASLPHWRGSRNLNGEANALSKLGEALYFLGDIKKAVDCFALELPLRQADGDRKGEAETLNNLAAGYAALGETEKALDYLNQALTIDRATGDRRGEARVLSNIGVAYESLGEMQKAIEYHNQALPIHRAEGNRKGEGSTLNSIGFIHQSLGEMQKALDYLSQALQIRRAVGDRRGEAFTLGNLGAAYNLRGETQKALDHYNQALVIDRAIGDRGSEARMLHNIAFAYDFLGDKLKALDHYNQALTIERAIGDRRGQAYTLGAIGSVYDSLGEKPKALEHYNQALAIDRLIGERRGEAYALGNIGFVYQSLGEMQKALDHYNQALAIERLIGERRAEAYTLSNMAFVYQSTGQTQQALDYYNEALAIGQAIGDRSGQAQTRRGIARVERRRGNLIEARSHIEAALTIVDSLRKEISSQDLRASYFASAHEYYEFYIDLLMELHRLDPTEGYNVIALEVSERARARSMLELLTEARADIRQGVDPALLESERSLQQLLNGKAEYQVRVLSGKHTDAQAKAVAKEIEALTTEYQQVEARIRQVSPRYAALTQPQPLTTQEIQQKLLDADTLLLEYSLGEERTYLWAVTQTSITSYVLPKRSEIEAAARQTYGLLTARQPVPDETLTQRQARVAQADAQYWRQAAALSQILLGPVASQLGKKRLLIVADGALQYVPFAALPAPLVNAQLSAPGEQAPASTKSRQAATNYQPLVIEHEIVSLPSASMLAGLRQEMVGRSPAAKAVVVLADPVFEKDDPRVKAARGQAAQPAGQSLTEDLERAIREVGVTDTAGGISRLPFSRQEAEAILAFAPEGEAMKAMDFKASRATATSPELSQYRIVHFATHGLLNSAHPELSGIVLSLIDEQDQPQDGFLRLHEIYNLNLPAELVVLSACRTGLGKDVKGEGLIGITRGFMYAGATRVVASLWKVQDDATAELMKYFYQGMLGKRMRPAAALRAAQVEMSKQKQWKAPYYWAAFVLQGQWK